MTQDKDYLEEIKRRAYRYFYIDGLAEIGIGVLFVLVGPLLLAMDATQRGTPLAWVAGVGLPLLIIGGTLLIRRLVQNAKERVTYPRTGYVSYREQPGRGRWVVIAGVFLLVVVGFIWPEGFSTSLVIGVVQGIVLAYLGYRAGLVRLGLVAVLAVVLALATVFVDLGDTVGSALVFAGTGLGLVLSGSLALISYLQHNPPPDEKDR